MTDRTRAERALAAVVHEIRDEWDEHGITATLRRCSDRPLADVAAAALYAAIKRTDQRTPACIALPGEHWQALTRLRGETASAPEPRCPDHGETLPCLTCQRASRAERHPLRPWREIAKESSR